MKQLFIVGNWKSNKTLQQAETWFAEFSIFNFQFSNKEIIICPPFTLLPNLKSYILDHKSPLRLGAQDISPFDEGAYTGEVNGKQIKEFCDYVIIGHSERRKYFGESEEIIKQKLDMAQKHKLTPILCISDFKQLANYPLPATRYPLIVAYEPLFAIGSGNPDTPENANMVAKEIKDMLSAPVLYGGSIKAGNVSAFTLMEHIDGVLVGGSSLDPKTFASIILNA